MVLADEHAPNLAVYVGQMSTPPNLAVYMYAIAMIVLLAAACWMPAPQVSVFRCIVANMPG